MTDINKIPLDKLRTRKTCITRGDRNASFQKLSYPQAKYSIDDVLDYWTVVLQRELVELWDRLGIKNTYYYAWRKNRAISSSKAIIIEVLTKGHFKSYDLISIDYSYLDYLDGAYATKGVTPIDTPAVATSNDDEF